MPGRNGFHARGSEPRGWLNTLLVALAAVVAPTLASHAASLSEGSCRGAVRHPIEVRIEALDPIQAAGVVRLRMEVKSAVALESVRARLTRNGAATVMGAREQQLALRPGRSSVVEFRVRVPAERALIQFQVEGEGNAGRLTRGAVYNLVPGGTEEQSRVVTRSDGTRVLEVTARRVGS